MMKFLIFFIIIFSLNNAFANKFAGTTWKNQTKCKNLDVFADYAKDDLTILSNKNISFPDSYGQMLFGKVRSNGVIVLENDTGRFSGKIKANTLKMRFIPKDDQNPFTNKVSRCKFKFVQLNMIDSKKLNTNKKVKNNITSSTGISSGTQEDLIVNIGDRVFFSYDSAELDIDAQELLQDQGAWLNQYPNTRVIIEGHADERSPFNYALGIANKRAISVKNYLINQGVDNGRISTVSYGNTRPAVVGSNDGAWAQNRRAVTIVD